MHYTDKKMLEVSVWSQISIGVEDKYRMAKVYDHLENFYPDFC